MACEPRPSSPGCGCTLPSAMAPRGVWVAFLPQEEKTELVLWQRRPPCTYLSMGLGLSVLSPGSRVSQSQCLTSRGGMCVGKLEPGAPVPLCAAVSWDGSLPIVTWRASRPSLLHGWPCSWPAADTAFLFLVKKPRWSVMILECEG